MSTGVSEASESDPGRARDAPAPQQGKLKRFLKGFFVFLLLGPLIGMWTFFVSYDVIFPSSAFSLSDFIGKLVMLTLVGFPFAYYIGFVPAALAGLLIASLQVLYRWFDGSAAFLVGVAIGLLFAAFVDTRSDQHLSPAWGYSAVKIFTCVVPTLVCWAVIRRWRTVDAPQVT